MQQPGHVASHTQTALEPLPMQRSPGMQAGPVPQRHSPEPGSHEFAAGSAQLLHDSPITPHSAPVGGLRQNVPWQHPFGHESAVHTHAPFWHSCPTRHGGLLPHAQPPFAQLFERWSHAMHGPPSLPHAPVSVMLTHWFDWQHPLHDTGSQTHMPFTQRWPARHGAFMPHAHWPPVQRSPPRWEQSSQIAPPRPQVPVICMPGCRHAPFEQQPPAQLPGLHPEHMPFVQL